MVGVWTKGRDVEITLKHTSPLRFAAVRDDALVTHSCDAVHWWNHRTGVLIRAMPTHPNTLLFAFGRTKMVCVARYERVIRVLDVDAGDVLRSIDVDITGDMYRLVLSEDERRVVIACVHVEDNGTTLVEVNIETGSQTSFATGSSVDCVALSTDGTSMVVTGQNGVVKVWDVASRAVVADLPPHPSRVCCLAMWNDAKIATSEYGNACVRVFDMRCV